MELITTGLSNEIKVELDNPTRTYFPGEIITGNVQTKLSSDVDLSAGITISLYGSATVSWSERELNEQEDKRYTAKDTIFKCSQNHPASYQPTTYPFSFQIPNKPGLPWSAITTHGKIEYGIEAMVMKSKLLQLGKRGKAKFTLNSVITSRTIKSLSSNPYFDKVRTSNVQETKVGKICFPCVCWYFCCANKKVEVGVSHKSLIAVPGETVHLTVEIDNGTASKHVGNVKIQLVQEWVHISGFKTKRTATVQHEQAFELEFSSEGKASKQESLQLPLILVPTQVESKALQLQYKIRVVLNELDGGSGGHCDIFLQQNIFNCR